MPSGHASHKGTADKPNTNAEGVMNTAADKAVDPEATLLEGITTNTTRTQEFVDNPAATDRPSEKPQPSQQD